MSILLVHECGHFIMALFFGWKTDKIYLYPYGGISKFETLVNVSLKEEFFVLIMGPISQIFFVYFLSFFLSLKNASLLQEYSLFLLSINLLPIYPLDGGRLLNIILSLYLPFRKSFIITIYISVFCITFFNFYFYFSYSVLLILVLLLFGLKTYEEYQKFPFVFQKFLLERKLYNLNLKKKKVIRDTLDMKRDTYHFFKIEKNYIPEKDYL